MRVPEFLLSHEVEVRRAVLQFSESLIDVLPQVLTPKTKTVLVEYSEDVCSTDPKKWRSAALAIADWLNDDFLCNLACIRQCLARRYDQGIVQYLSLVLQPSLRSLDSIELRFPAPSKQLEDLRAFVRDIVNTAETVSDAIDRYYDACGYIPLAESVSVGRIVREWAVHHREDKNLWKQVWRWAEQKGSPLARYHACQAFSVNPELVPAQDISMLWRELANVIHASYTENAEKQWTEAWRLRCELARHYEQTLECQWAGQESERLAAFAWWMAETVAAVFGVSSSLLKQIREKVVAPVEEHSHYIWQLARPPIQPSTIRCATVLTKSVWSLALQCQIGPLIQQHATNSIESPVCSVIQTAIEANVLQLFPPDSPPGTDPVYAYEKTSCQLQKPG